MSTQTATAQASPNIAFIKYWGNRNQELRLPANGSISMNLEGLHSTTHVAFSEAFGQDEFSLNGAEQSGAGRRRVSAFLDLVRGLAGISLRGRVESTNNFPTGAGIASSASAFAALSLAASTAAGLDLDDAALSRLARRGSGSACRSVPGGFVEWQTGTGDEDSYAYAIAPVEHWALADCVAIVSRTHKPTGSTEGHGLADSSPLQAARVADAPRRLDICRRAILERDFEAFAEMIEWDSNLMHAVMMTSQPRLLYWEPATVQVMQAVTHWRKQQGWAVGYTIDAGPNVHVITLAEQADQVRSALLDLPGVSEVLVAYPGGAARLIAGE